MSCLEQWKDVAIGMNIMPICVPDGESPIRRFCDREPFLSLQEGGSVSAESLLGFPGSAISKGSKLACAECQSKGYVNVTKMLTWCPLLPCVTFVHVIASILSSHFHLAKSPLYHLRSIAKPSHMLHSILPWWHVTYYGFLLICVFPSPPTMDHKYLRGIVFIFHSLFPMPWAFYDTLC